MLNTQRSIKVVLVYIEITELCPTVDTSTLRCFQVGFPGNTTFPSHITYRPIWNKNREKMWYKLALATNYTEFVDATRAFFNMLKTEYVKCIHRKHVTNKTTTITVPVLRNKMLSRTQIRWQNQIQSHKIKCAIQWIESKATQNLWTAMWAQTNVDSFWCLLKTAEIVQSCSACSASPRVCQHCTSKQICSLEVLILASPTFHSFFQENQWKLQSISKFSFNFPSPS